MMAGAATEIRNLLFSSVKVDFELEKSENEWKGAGNNFRAYGEEACDAKIEMFGGPWKQVKEVDMESGE